MQEREFDDSIQELRELVKQYEECIESKDSIFFEESDIEDIADYYLSNQYIDKALDAVEVGLNLYQYTVTFYIKKAEILIELGQYDEAWKLLEEGEAYSPNDVHIALSKAYILSLRSEYEKAIDLINNVFHTADVDEKIDIFLELSDIYEDWEKYDKVVENLIECLKLDHENEEALNRLWFCVELTESYQTSVKFHLWLIEQTPYNYIAWYNLAHAYNGLKKWDKAVEAFKFVIAISEEYHIAYIDCADVLYKKGNTQEALQYYKDSTEKSTPKKEVLYRIGKCYSKIKNYTKAREYYKKAISIDPYYAKAFYRMGESFVATKQYQNAVSPFQRAIKLDHKNVDYITGLANTYVRLQAYDQAIELYHQLLTHHPLDKKVHMALVTLLYEKGCTQDAIEHIDSVVSSIDDNADLRCIKAAFLYESGKIIDAIQVLQSALLEAPDMLEYIVHLVPDIQDEPDFIEMIGTF